MTSEERKELINRPFQIRTLPRSYPWAGTITHDTFADPESLEARIERMGMRRQWIDEFESQYGIGDFDIYGGFDY